MSELSRRGERIYYAYTTKHPIRDCDHSGHIVRDCPEFRTIANAMFYQGAQYALHASAELSPHIARFIEFIMWLTDKEELPIDDEVAQ
jgi:hypothetical protein